MKLSNIGGRKICGLRGGRSFREAVRPSLKDGSCPEGFVVCPSGEEGASSNTSTF